MRSRKILMSIHSTAVIDSRAEIDTEVEIGPYVVIEGPVKIKRRTRIMAQAYVTGWTEIGEDNEIHPGAMLGEFLDLFRGQFQFLVNRLIREDPERVQIETEIGLVGQGRATGLGCGWGREREQDDGQQ